MTSVVSRSRSASLGIGVAWWIYVARRRPAPAAWPALEHKFCFDELYDAVFYRPAVALGEDRSTRSSKARSSAAR